MTGTVATVLAALVGGVGAYFTWRSTTFRQRRSAAKDIKAETEAAEKRKDAIRNAVYSGDDEELNRVIQDLMES